MSLSAGWLVPRLSMSRLMIGREMFATMKLMKDEAFPKWKSVVHGVHETDEPDTSRRQARVALSNFPLKRSCCRLSRMLGVPSHKDHAQLHEA